MIQRIVRIGLLAFAATPLLAQGGNEAIFLGGTGPGYSLVDASTGVATPGSHPAASGVRGAVFADAGRHLYVANAVPATGTGISSARWNGAAATWSSFYPLPDAAIGLGFDRARSRLWVLTGNPVSGRQLHCVDANTTSTTYGQRLAQTSLAPVFRDHWALSPSGNLAAVPADAVSSNLFEIVDTDPSSTRFTRVVIAVPLSSTGPGSGQVLGCAITADDQHAFVLVADVVPYLGVLHIPSRTWLDFDPVGIGQQHLLLPQVQPDALALAPDASYVVITGRTAGLGLARRFQLDYQNPDQTAAVDCLTGVVLNSCHAPSVSFDSTRIALVANGRLCIADAQSGALLQAIAVSGEVTAWQDLRPTAGYALFGAGCAGTLGVPSLALDPATPAPMLGTTFTLKLNHLPTGLALVGFGFSATTYNGLPLPLPLAGYGMPSCTLLAAPEVVTLVLGNPSAAWSLPIPNAAGLGGLQFWNQAFALDPAANATGVTVSNAGVGRVGV